MAVLAVALLLAGVGSQLGTGVFYVYVEEVSPPDSGGTSLAVLMTLSIGGSLTAPVAAGLLVDVASWSAAFGFGVALAVAGVAALAGVSEASHGAFSDPENQRSNPEPVRYRSPVERSGYTSYTPRQRRIGCRSCHST